jgi:hypothetical protein
MKKATLLALGALLAAIGVQAEEMNVIRIDGQVEAFDLAEIDSVTFSLPGAKAISALRAGLRGTNDRLLVHTHDGTQQLAVAEIDSVCFGSSHLMTIYQSLGITSQFSLAEIDSMTFASGMVNTVTIAYNGTSVTVDNPLEAAGVAVAVTGADVIVTAAAGIEGIIYVLSGSTPDGVFKIYSDSDLTLRLDGVQITNPNQPAVNIQADHEITVELVAGANNILTDGVTYAAAPGGEDQKAAFFSEGQLIFIGPGSLTVNGLGSAQHGLGSDNFIAIQSGTVVVTSAVRDGVHTNDGYFQDGGTVSVVGGYDGIDGGDGPIEIAGGNLTVLIPGADRDAIKCSGTLQIAGGVLDLTVQGNQSKGLNAADILLTGGTVTMHTSGGVVLEASGLGFDPSYCTGIKGDNLVQIDGCALSITASGIAGRGISCDGDIEILSGSVAITGSGNGGTYTDATGVIDAFAGHCLNSDADVVLRGGTITLTNSGSGAKGINGDSDLSIGTAIAGPTLQVTTSGAAISLGGGEYAEAKAVSVDSLITVSSGSVTLSSPDDALKSKVRIDVNGGTINIVSSKEGIEAPNISITDGVIHLNSTDDGINATYGDDVEYDDGSVLVISGGYVHLNAIAGDGIDSNGDLTLSGGTIIVHGPPAQPEVGLDVNGTFRVDGGFTVVSQINSNMVETPSGVSTQRCVMLKTTSTIAANTLFHIESSTGTSILTFRPARNYSCILFSSSAISAGTNYRVYTGGTCTGTAQDGLYTGGTYTPGTLRTTFTSSAMVQTVNF